MSILGEVCIRRLRCIQQFTMDQGLTEVYDIDCRLSGIESMLVYSTHIRASIHVRTATFDNEKWKLITLMCSHYASYHNLFPPNCGSVGEFTDIRQDEERYLAITPEMHRYNLPVQRLNGDFYEQVRPFNTKLFRKAHPAGTLLFSGIHSHLVLLQHLLIELPRAKKPVHIISDVPKYWLEDDGTMCLDDDHRWRSAATIQWLKVHGLFCVPSSIKAEIGNLVYNQDRSRASDDPPPGL